jgi:ribosome-binding protein aMBF1 (putative translation factor)
MMMGEATPRRVSLAEAREARIHRPEVAAAYEQSGLRYDLAAAIRARREELGWSQRQLAELAGMTSPASPASRPVAPLPPCGCWNASPARCA